MTGRVVYLGDSCAAVQFARTIDPAVNARCIALASRVERRGVPGVRDVVATYNAVTVHFNPMLIDRRTLEAELDSAARQAASVMEREGRTVEIPVRYGGEDGPDLTAVAAFARCAEQEVVRRHTSATYRVYMMGFLPGFAYMGSVDSRIAMPRLETPRLRVASGSVGIAGEQTGIYPFDSPGGWRIVGRTSIKLFDPSRPDPFLLQAGDRVTFVAV